MSTSVSTIGEARTVVNVCVVPDVETLADNTTLAAADGRLDGKRELDRADVRDTSLEQRARGRAPDGGRVDGEGTGVALLASSDDGLSRALVGKAVVVLDKIGVGVLGDLVRGRSTVRAEVGPDTSTAGVDVDGLLASLLEAVLGTLEQSLRTGEVEDVGLWNSLLEHVQQQKGTRQRTIWMTTSDCEAKAVMSSALSSEPTTVLTPSFSSLAAFSSLRTRAVTLYFGSL